MGCRLVGRIRLRPGSPGTWLPAPALSPGPGDLGLVPTHFSITSPIYKKWWMKLVAPFQGLPSKPHIP